MIIILCPTCHEPIRDWRPYRVLGALHIVATCCGERRQIEVQGRVVVSEKGEVSIEDTGLSP